MAHPESFGAAFGPSDRDLCSVTAWLSSHGFDNIRVNSGRTLIEFSETAGMVRSAFSTNMHRYMVRGDVHFANDSGPQIPVALAPVVAGVASLNNFARRLRAIELAVFDTMPPRISRLDFQRRPLTRCGRPSRSIAATTRFMA